MFYEESDSSVEILKNILFLPLVLIGKILKTCFRAIGVVISIALLALTLGASECARNYFVERVAKLSQDITDWVLMPFGILNGLCKASYLAIASHRSRRAR